MSEISKLEKNSNYLKVIWDDGQEDENAPYDEDIVISKMDNKLRLVHPLNNDFFEACREKLGWSLDISKK